MELHQLRYFVAVADLGNFTRAAERCFVSQPSLSQQIIKLEKELGQPLFDRLGRSVRLTEPGRALYQRARAVLNALEDAKQSISDSGADGTGTIRLGVIPTIAPYFIPPLLQRFARRFPKAEIFVEENVTEIIIRDCLSGEIDLGVLALPIEEQQLCAEPLFTEELLLAVPKRHPLATKRRVTMRDIDQERFILLHETHCLAEQIISFCKARSCQPAISCASAQLLTVQELVALGHGISLVPKMAAVADRTNRCKYRSLAGTKPTRTVGFIRHKDRFQNRLMREFIALLRAEAAAKSASSSKGSRRASVTIAN